MKSAPKRRLEHVRRVTGIGLGLVLLSAASACGEEEGSSIRNATAVTPPSHVDSVFPIEEEIRRFVRPPYQMSPELLWFQIENASATGLRRVIDRFGGRGLKLASLTCAAEPESVGVGRVWNGCSVGLILGEGEVLPGSQPGGEIVELSLFGPILEWSGRFKFLGYGNRL